MTSAPAEELEELADLARPSQRVRHRQLGLDRVAIAAAVAGGFFLLAYILAKLIFPRIQEPLGAGDVFLALMMGLMLGFPNIVGALLIGPLIAGAAAILLLVVAIGSLIGR